MKNLNKNKFDPFLVICIWLGGGILIIIVAILMGINFPETSEKPLIFLSVMIPITVYGTLILSILTIPFYSKSGKGKWYLNLIFIIPCCLFVYKDWQEKQDRYYSASETKEIVNNKEYEKTIEYYGRDFQQIKRVSFTHNDMKDSIWTFYDVRGKIIKSVRYRNDTLIKRIEY